MLTIHRMLIAYAATASLVLLSTACGGSPEPAAEPTASPTPAPPSAASTGSTGDSVTAAGIVFDLPDGWQQQAPDTSMRLAQASISGSAGDGLLTVFFFGPGGGGSAQMNIDRWVGQMESEPGVEPVVEQTQSGEFQLSFVEHQGTLKASMMGFPDTDQPGYTLLGAVVEGPGGPWFFKAVGPQETLAAERDAFRSMIEGIRLAS